MRLDKGLEAGVLLVQGILAGLTLASLYAVLLGDSLQNFIAAYEVQIPPTVKLVALPVLSLPKPQHVHMPGRFMILAVWYLLSR